MKTTPPPLTPPLTPEDSPGRVVNREADSLPNVDAWPHRPLLLCVNSATAPDLRTPDCGASACPLGVPLSFSSDLFEGRLLFRIRNARSNDPVGDEEHFAGRKRTFQLVIQGRFKEDIPVADILMGHELARPAKNLPPALLVRTGEALARKIVPGVELSCYSDQPYLLSVMASRASKTVRADHPGNQPDIRCHDIQEDCTLFGGAFSEGNVSTYRRAKIFAYPNMGHEYIFNTKTVYTFEFYEYLMDFESYSACLPFAKISLAPILDGQPLQLLAKLRDGRYAWSFQLWHEKLLPTETSRATIPNALTLDLSMVEHDDTDFKIVTTMKSRIINSASSADSSLIHGMRKEVDASRDDDGARVSSSLVHATIGPVYAVTLDCGWSGKFTPLNACNH